MFDLESSEPFDVFLSYNSRDYEWVRAAKDALNQRGIRSFLDRDNLPKGRPWPKALEEILQQVRAVAVFIGPHGIGNWQTREIWFALDIQAKRGNESDFPVVPIVLPHSDPPVGFLLLNTWINLKDGSGDDSAWQSLANAIRGNSLDSDSEELNTVCPYRDLRTFREVDAPFFFGRESFSERLFQRIQKYKMLALVGPSGSGKSSIVMAGLLPLLRKQRPPAPAWDTIIFTPGSQPFHRFAAAMIQQGPIGVSFVDQLVESKKLGDRLEDGSALIGDAISKWLECSNGTDRLLVVVDQFEELFTMSSIGVRERFADALIDISNLRELVVIITLRADFYGSAIGLSRNFSDRLEEGLLNVGQMSQDELTRAIVKPAHQVKLEFEVGLAQQLQEDVGTEPGNLALLEFALTQLWEQRSGKLLTQSGYEAIGRIDGAIAKRAAEVVREFTESERALVREVFSRLVRLGRADEGTEDTRQRAEVRDFGPNTQLVISRLADARLVVTSRDSVTGEEIVEITHEALIRRWEDLKAWLNEDREFLLWRQRLRSAVSQWHQANQDRGALLRGGLLIEAKTWRERNHAGLNAREHAFIGASLKASLIRRWSVRAALIAGVVILGATIFWLAKQLRQERMLSDLQRLEVLESEADRLWPPDSKHVSELEVWLRSARELSQRMDGYKKDLVNFESTADAQELKRLQAEKSEIESALSRSMTVADGDDLRHKLLRVNENILPLQRKADNLTKLASGLSRFNNPDPAVGTIAAMQARFDLASNIRKRTIDDERAAWDLAISSIADPSECRLYRGLHIQPQEGLIPLRRNSQSKLWEFWQVQSGFRPEINADGTLRLTPESGLVFVLIPSGIFKMGAVRPARTNHLSANEDPMATNDESIQGQLPEVTIAKPFFLSKYEVTQGQYQRLMLTNPSFYTPTLDKQITLVNPVEQVDWYDSNTAAFKLGCRLPTEAEWEYAARAGTTTIWWTGNDVRSLSGAANLSDKRHAAAGHPGESEDWLDDGFEKHAPVGSFRANNFGLHDMVGNVWEWCFDVYAPYRLSVNVDTNNNIADRTNSLGIIRGGSWASSAAFSRSAYRDPYQPTFRYYALGFRPARNVDE